MHINAKILHFNMHAVTHSVDGSFVLKEREDVRHIEHVFT